jgi:hypothetical protein
LIVSNEKVNILMFGNLELDILSMFWQFGSRHFDEAPKLWLTFCFCLICADFPTTNATVEAARMEPVTPRKHLMN